MNDTNTTFAGLPEMYAAGITYKAMAAHYGVPESKLERALDVFGVKRHGPFNKACLFVDCRQPFETDNRDRRYCSVICRKRAVAKNWFNKAGNRERANTRRRLWQGKRDRVKYLKAKREDYARNREGRLVWQRRYYKANRFRWVYQRALRRSREKCSPEELSKCEKFISAVTKRRVNICYYCQKRITGSPHIDHITALARGGKHEVSNLCVAHPSCNSSKHTKSVSELNLPQPLLAL